MTLVTPGQRPLPCGDMAGTGLAFHLSPILLCPVGWEMYVMSVVGKLLTVGWERGFWSLPVDLPMETPPWVSSSGVSAFECPPLDLPLWVSLCGSLPVLPL